MRIALGQINTTVGDIAGNVALITRLAHTAAERGAELAVFPELSITGYPPRDLVERRGFVERSEDGVQRLAEATAKLPLAIVAGYVGRSSETTGKQTTNSAVIVQGGRVLLRQTKMLLPTYDVFDEGRNFVHWPSSIHLGARHGKSRAHHLRRFLERQALLDAPPLRTRPR